MKERPFTASFLLQFLLASYLMRFGNAEIKGCNDMINFIDNSTDYNKDCWMCGNLSINGGYDGYDPHRGNRTNFLFTNVFLPAALVRFYFVIFSIIRGDIYNF